jgi:hypothetical protein
MDFDLSANMGASSVTGTLTAMTLSSCTDSIPVISISHCSLAPGSTPLTHLTAAATTWLQRIVNWLVRCNIAGSTTSFCYYNAPDASGTGSNINSSLTFSSVPIVNAGGSGSLGAACGPGTGTMNSVHTALMSTSGTKITVTST